MKNLRSLFLSCLPTFWVGAAAAQQFIAEPNAITFPIMSADQKTLYGVSNGALQVYGGANFAPTQTIPILGAAFPTCLAITATKAVIGLAEQGGDVTKPAFQVVDLATLAVSYGYLKSVGHDANNVPLVGPLSQGGCTALPNGKVLFGDAFDTTLGSFSGFPKLALVDPNDNGVQYGSTNTTRGVLNVYPVPNTTQCVVFYGSGTHVNALALVDTTNMGQPVTTVPFTLQPKSSPAFANGKMYITGVDTGAKVDLQSLVVTYTEDLRNYTGISFSADGTYYYALASNILVTKDEATGAVLSSQQFNIGNVGPFTQIWVSRDQSNDKDHVTMLPGNGLVITDQVRPSPIVNAVLDTFAYHAGAITGNEWVAIFGRNLGRTSILATLPLPTNLNGTTVTLQCAGSNPVALQQNYNGPGQINVLTPKTLACLTATLLVTTTFADGTSVSTPPIQLVVASSAPALLQDAQGNAYVQHLDANATVNVTAALGETVIAYGVGFGQTHDVSGLQWTDMPPVITIGGRQANVLFSGLCPAFVGLYQINLVIPMSAPAGSQNLAVTIGEGREETKINIAQ